jgi:hypothetical protein
MMGWIVRDGPERIQSMASAGLFKNRNDLRENWECDLAHLKP